MGHRIAQRDGADQQPDPQAAIGPGPGGDDPHADRVDPDKRETGEEAQREGESQSRRNGNQRRGGRGEERGKGEEPACGNAVGEVEEGRSQGADDEAELHRHRQPGPTRLIKIPRSRQGGDHRRGREPGRHREQCGQRQPEQRRPLPEFAARPVLSSPPALGRP